MASSESVLKNDRESAFSCFQNLLNSGENRSKTFFTITNDLKKFVFTSFSISLFNFNMESKILQMKDYNTDEINDIYRSLKYYFKLNLANSNYLLRKTEIIYKLVINLTTEISKQEDYIFEEEENIKKYKKIIKFFYFLYLILNKFKESLSYEDKFLSKSIRKLGNFLTNLNSFKNDFVEKNISTFFIDLMYLGISQIGVSNSKSSLGSNDDNRLTNLLDGERQIILVKENKILSETNINFINDNHNSSNCINNQIFNRYDDYDEIKNISNIKIAWND